MALYEEFKRSIIRQVLDGTFKSGSTLPTEHELCEKYGISRVTVRKALDELKKDGLIVSVQGQGTLVSSRKGGYRSSLELIALVAPVHNPFFASFMESFEQVAEENGSLVLFKQDFQGKAFSSEDLFYRFITMNIRNVVFWPQNDNIDFDMLKRLRSVGMNLVFFDQMYESDVADVVGIDNRHAVSELYKALQAAGADNILYLGYEGLNIPSEVQREQAFRELSRGEQDMYRIPWGEEIGTAVARLLDGLNAEGKLPAGLLCCNGPIGLEAAKHLEARGMQGSKLAVIDYLPEMSRFNMIAYQQPMREMAEKIYQQLIVQNNQGELWQPRCYPVQGNTLTL